jgi:hypothetical protein
VPVIVSVRRPRPADAKDASYLSGTEAMSAAVGVPVIIGATFGAAAIPLLYAYAAYFAVGLPATYVLLETPEVVRQGVMARVLAETDFAGMATESLISRAPFTLARPTEPNGPGGRVDVEITGYGIGGTAEHACVFAYATVLVSAPGLDPQRETVAIGPASATEGAPPAFCTSMQRLLADDAALARKSLRELAITLGAVIARRLEVSA